MSALGKMPIVSNAASLASKSPVVKAVGLDDEAIAIRRNAKKDNALFSMATKPKSMLSK